MASDAAPPSPSRGLSGRLLSQGRTQSSLGAQVETLESVQAMVAELQEECQMYESHIAAIDSEGSLDDTSVAEAACVRLAEEEQILRQQLDAIITVRSRLCLNKYRQPTAWKRPPGPPLSSSPVPRPAPKLNDKK